MKKYIFSLPVILAVVLGANSALANTADSIYTYYIEDNCAVITGGNYRRKCVSVLLWH